MGLFSRGRHSAKILVGVFGPSLETLTLFQIKSVIFHSIFRTRVKKSMTSFRPLKFSKFPILNSSWNKGYCIALHCIVLHCIVLHCIALHRIASHCIVLYCIVLYCIVLYCIVLYCIVLYCIVLYCIVLYCMTVANQKWLPFTKAFEKSYKFTNVDWEKISSL